MSNPHIPRWPYCFLKFFVGFLFFCSVVSSVCLESQNSLLLQLKEELSINSQTDSKLLSWIPTKDCCLWDGVTCDPQTGYVIGLDLSSSSITAGINSSSSLFGLYHLQKLTLAHNTFSSPFPSGFSRLPNLTHLNLSYTGFYGEVPSEISLLRNLISLDLSTVKLHNQDLENLIKNSTRLEELVLDGTDISMESSKLCLMFSSTLPNIRVLSLSNCNLTGPLHPSLLRLQFLTNINLNGNNLASEVPKFLAKFSSLTSLKLSACGFYGRFPEDIFFMPALRLLDISYNHNLAGTLPEFPPGSAFEVIYLSNTMFSGTLPNSISNLASLRDLQLSECNFSGSIASFFDFFTELHYLDISSNNFSGPIPLLASSKMITAIILSHNHFTGNIPLLYGSEFNNLEVLDLRNNSLQGMIPSALFTNPSIKWLRLAENHFSGQVQEFQNAASSTLREIDLSKNDLHGPVPLSFFNISELVILRLSSNQFNGTITVDMMVNFNGLAVLDLSDNNFSFEDSGSNSTTLSHIATLGLGSCNITKFPEFIRNPLYLGHLDLSNNKISGEIPNWIWELGNGSLVYLNLSYNLLSGFENPGPNLSSSHLVVLDLHSNLLEGSFLMPSPSIIYLDYSNNKLSSTLPSDIFDYLFYAAFISLSSNYFTGNIPGSICRTEYLLVLDLSNNYFNSSIPPCLGSNESLKALKLRNNKLHGMLPRTFEGNCTLQTVDLNNNHLEGPLPRSLTNCKDLVLLDVGNNHFNGSFPFWLEKLLGLRVLILQSNDFRGSIGHSKSVNAFPMLQIIDLSSNNFKGNLPSDWFKSWKGMMKEANHSQSYQVLRYYYLELSQLYYQDSVTIMNKGLSMKLEKILTIFASIDLSNNQFEGEIPDAIVDLVLLHALNMSHNHLKGHIPSSFEQLKELESLDLSANKFSGKIPQQLAALTFLSVLNLSQNLLVGEIPQENQFGTFPASSFEGNIGLCGLPLSKTCALPPMVLDTSPESSKSIGNIDWDFFWIGFGCGCGMGINIGIIAGCVTFNIIWKRRIRRRHKRSIIQLDTQAR